MSAALFTHLVVPSIVLVLLAITAIYLSRLTFDKGVEHGRRLATETYQNKYGIVLDTLDRYRRESTKDRDEKQRIRRNAIDAIRQMEERHQRELAVLEQQRQEQQQTDLIIERRQAGEIINLLRVSSPLLHAGQQYQAAQSADAIRLNLQKQLLTLRLVEHEAENTAAAGEGTT